MVSFHQSPNIDSTGSKGSSQQGDHRESEVKGEVQRFVSNEFHYVKRPEDVT